MRSLVQLLTIFGCLLSLVAGENTRPREGLKPFEYEPAQVPFYSPGPRKDGPRGADGWNKMQKPVDAAESMKHLVVPSGFEARLFAAEPEIAKPIAMVWDARGRLWIAETLDYPNDMKQRGEGSDRIKICEDTDGDGKADKFTVFADKLSIPTSLVFANGGLIVHQAPDTLFLKDTNGDDKADEVKALFTGWGTGDTHAGPSNLQYGFDNWIYGMVGYSGFKGTVGGEELKFGAGFYRFKADGSKLEFLRSTSNNSWGVGVSEEGLVFGSTANGTPSVFLSIPNRYYERVKGWSSSVLPSIAESNRFAPVTDKVRQVDVHGGFTAAAGHALYTARAYPKEYWNRAAFVNEPTGHLAATFWLERDGANFIAKTGPNLAASDDEWTAPIVTEVGPDGMVWMIDWYNYIIQHNPTPHGFKNGRGNAYDTPLRDKRHGRIYRLVFTGAKSAAAQKLDTNDPASLVAALKSDNMLWRRSAQRMLVDRANTDVVPELWKLVSDTSVDAIGLNPAAIHALWTLQGLNAIDDARVADLKIALKHPSAGVRRTAVLVLPRSEAGSTVLIESGIVADKDAQARLAAMLTISEMHVSDALASALAEAASSEANLKDRWLPDALSSAAAAHDLAFLRAMATRKTDAANAVRSTLIARVTEHAVRRDPVNIHAVMVTLNDASSAFCESLLAGIAAGLPKDTLVKLNPDAEAALIKAAETATQKMKSALAALGRQLDSAAVKTISAAQIDAARMQVLDAKAADDIRGRAAEQWVDFLKSESAPVEGILAQITPRASLELTRSLLEALRRSSAPVAGSMLVEKLGSLTPAARTHAIALLLGRQDWTEAFVVGLENGKAQLADLSLDQKQALASHPVKKVADTAKKVLKSGGGLPDADRQQVINALAKQVLAKGDVAKGKAIYQTNCMKCHTHSGEGQPIGPDLTGMASHSKDELLIHIMDPSRSVEGNFRQYTVSTTEGQHVVGLLSSETKTSVEILDAEGRTHAILRENIKRMSASQLSLMPEGFEKQMKVEEVTDLLEFLTHHGTHVPLDLRKAATISTMKGMFNDETSQVERLVFSDWKPKTFEGVTYQLVDPKDGRANNAILLNSTSGKIPPIMPKSVSVACNLAAKKIHVLGGVAGWAFNGSPVDPTVSMIVRLHYAGGKTEDHALKNGVHIADYIRVVDVPESKLAFKVRGQQVRVLQIQPKQKDVIERIEFVKGPDATAPVVMAVTVEVGE